MRLFDTHAHLDDEQFNDSLPDVLERAARAGVETIVAVGTTAASSARCVALASQHAGVHAAVGIQPNYCQDAAPGDWDEIVRLAREARPVALGETGLDKHWDYSPLPLQQDYFDRHLRLSQELDLPFIVHLRESGAEIVEMLVEARQRGSLRGVMHSFTGDWELAGQCLELGLHISFAGMVTFKKSAALREVARQTPADRLLIETDAPYLSPHPERGRRPNEPALLVHTAACLAETRDVSVEQLSQQTCENAEKLFGVCQ